MMHSKAQNWHKCRHNCFFCKISFSSFKDFACFFGKTVKIVHLSKKHAKDTSFLYEWCTVFGNLF